MPASPARWCATSWSPPLNAASARRERRTRSNGLRTTAAPRSPRTRSTRRGLPARRRSSRPSEALKATACRKPSQNAETRLRSGDDPARRRHPPRLADPPDRRPDRRPPRGPPPLRTEVPLAPQVHQAQCPNPTAARPAKQRPLHYTINCRWQHFGFAGSILRPIADAQKSHVSAGLRVRQRRLNSGRPATINSGPLVENACGLIANKTRTRENSYAKLMTSQT